MSKKIKRILLIIIILFLLLIASALFVLLKSKIINIPIIKKPSEEKKIEKPKLPSTEGQITVAPKEENAELEVKRLASLFAERFGSFSNQAPLQNLIELKPFMTKKMQTWVDKEMQGPQEKTDPYHGFVTKAIFTKILDLGKEEAKVLIQTQRQEATKTTDNIRIFYQEIEMEIIKEGGEWKVDEARWLNK